MRSFRGSVWLRTEKYTACTKAVPTEKLICYKACVLRQKLIIFGPIQGFRRGVNEILSFVGTLAACINS